MRLKKINELRFSLRYQDQHQRGEKNQHYLSKLRTKTKLIEIKLAELCRKTKFL